MKISFSGYVLENITTDFKDKDGQPQLKRVLVVAPNGDTQLIKVNVPMTCKIKAKEEHYFEDVEMKRWEMNGKSGNSFKYDDTIKGK